jgi:hypothetical protein
MTQKKNRYTQIIETIFFKYYQEDSSEIAFKRSDIVQVARELDITLPKNLGDIIYSFRYRATLPETIIQKAPKGYEWVIRPAGRARYKFSLTTQTAIIPTSMLVETKIPDATPGIISRYALDDEQGLLAKIRYNRLIDIFTGLTCYSLQNHLRTTVEAIGQVETDEIYIGIDKRGVHYAIPVQAKGGSDKIGPVQIEQDFAVCAAKFPDLICLPVAAQFMDNDVIALFAFEEDDNGVAVSAEKHYRLVKPEDLSPEELASYRIRPV